MKAVIVCFRSLWRLGSSPIRALWRLLRHLENLIVRVVLTSVQFIAVRCARVVVPALLGCVVLLLWNHHAAQAPAWIAVALAVICSGGISLLGAKESVRKNPYLIGMASFLALVPTAFGCWATLQPVPYEELFPIVTAVFDRESAEIFPRKALNRMRNKLYMFRAREFLEEELGKRLAERVGDLDARIATIRNIASSMEFGEFLLLREMGFLFQYSWKIKMTRGEWLGVKRMGLSGLDVRSGQKNLWRKADLQRALPNNEFLALLSDDFKIALPPGMDVSSRQLLRYPGDTEHALVFKDQHCRVDFIPHGGMFGPALSLNIERGDQFFSEGVDLQLLAEFFGIRVGTNGTKERRELWLTPLIDHLHDTFTNVEVNVDVGRN